MRSSSSTNITRTRNPRANANCFSALTFWYTIRTFYFGLRHEFLEEDLPECLPEHSSSYLGEKIAKHWSNEYENSSRKQKRPNLTKVITKTFLWDFMLYGLIIFLMEMFIKIPQPLFIGLFIRYFNEENRNSTNPVRPPTYFNRVFAFWTPNQGPIVKSEAYFFASGIFFFSIAAVLMSHPYYMACFHMGMKIRVALCSLMYRKALRIRLTSLDGQTVGNVVNLMANDVTRFDTAIIFLHYLWISPLQACFITYFMYFEVQISAVIGLTAVVIFIPLQIYLGLRTVHLREDCAIRTDDRVRQMNEIIQSMQVIKMYAWEKAFGDIIHELRRRELRTLLRTSYIRGIIMSFIMFISRSGIFLTILAYVLLDNDITAEKVFVISSYYMVLRQTMTIFLPQGIVSAAEAYVSVQRIVEFMLIDEANLGDPTPLDPLWAERSNMKFKPRSVLQLTENPRIVIYRGIAKYGDNVCLENINMEASPGQITAIVGPVGAGKSCLLKLILGELFLFSGRLTVMGNISYACQDPWLFAGSVRQNILFGKPMNLGRYRDVVKVCALSRDFSLLPYGDNTVVGERGISLSGGQRARINLARAVYKESSIYLLDDPLSAVDINVGQQLFDNCISSYLKDKIVVLVTHQLQYLKKAHQIIIMDEGLIQGTGTFSELQKSGLSFATLLQDTASSESESENDVEKILKRVSRVSAAFNSIIDIEGLKFRPKPTYEMRTMGSVAMDNYKQYFTAGTNCCGIMIMVLFFLLAQVCGSGGDFFLSQWTTLEELRAHFGTGASMGFYDKLSTNDCIFIYTAIIIATIVIAVVRSIVFYSICMKASMRLHDRMFASITHASMAFFNTNTSGTILNRFAKDMGCVDELLPNAFIDTAQLMLNLVGAIVVLAVLEPYLLVPNFIIGLIFWGLRAVYLKTSRSIKRLEGICRSPVYAHLNATLAGLATIRCHEAEQQLVSEFDNLQDINSTAYFMFLYTSRAFGFWVDFICTLYIGLVTFTFILIAESYDGSTVGLAITQTIGLTGLIQWGLRQSAELENQMTSVERVLEFTRVEHEPALESTPEMKPPPTWPKRGKIEFIETTMSYSAYDPPVLKGLNILIKAKEKVGIVGRTGAGKSSLISTLFRLAPYKGEILIDSLDVSVIGLHDLRRKISIIPQEPVLFSGTLRYNLDPFGEYNDDDVLAALTDVELRNVMLHGADCLDDMMVEGGTTLSVGQRQMVCLARAILRDNKILVMDEATANVDAATDKFIQKTIRTKFEHCTVLTIAHRLHTIMDSDRVLVMDAGMAVEFDHPHLLLQNRNGYLFQMVKKTGPGTSDTLIRIAKESYQHNNQDVGTSGSSD